jgi:methionine-rich copper-binding protein CopC
MTACAPVLAAPPHLVAAWPADGANLPVTPQTLELTFNTALHPESTWAAVWRAEDGATLATETSIDPGDGRRLSMRLQQPTAGQFRLHWHAVAARTGAVADGEQDFSMQDESAGSPRLEVSRTTAESGEKLELSGSGFTPRTTVQMAIGDDEQPLTTADTDARGAFDIQTRVPAGVPFGMQTISAVDASGNSAAAALQVRWGGWPPLVAFTVGHPGPEVGDVTFSLSMRNRSDYVLERIVIRVADPEGATFVTAQPRPQREGRAIVWDLPTMYRGVAGPFQATYRVGGVVTSHAHIEFRHRRPRGCSSEECLPAFLSETTSDSPPVRP